MPNERERLTAAYEDGELRGQMARVVRRHYRSSPAEIEDILQETYTAALERRPFPDDLPNWLLTRAEHAARKAAQEARLRDGDVRAVDEEARAALYPRQPAPAWLLNGHSDSEMRPSLDQRLRLREACRALPVGDQRLLNAMYWDARTLRDIARTEGLHHTTVLRKHVGIIQKLRQAVGGIVGRPVRLPVAEGGKPIEETPIKGWVKGQRAWGSPYWTCGMCQVRHPVSEKRCVQ